MLPQLHTLDEVAISLAVRPSTVKRWIREGRLRCLRRGRNWVRVSSQAVEAFLKREAVESQPAPESFERSSGRLDCAA